MDFCGNQFGAEAIIGLANRSRRYTVSYTRLNMRIAQNQSSTGSLFACGDPEELANTITHGLGFAFSVVAAFLLLRSVAAGGDGVRLIGSLSYVGSMMAVYATSTLSHSCSFPDWRKRLRSWDQGCIFLLIVGTYTPLSLAYLRTPFWNCFLAVMWAIASYGFASKVFWRHRVEKQRVTIWLYVLLGWLPILSVPSVIRVAPQECLSLILGGGLFYTFGTLFLVNDKRVRYFHAVWHVFVISGSACHFAAIFCL